MSADSLPLAAAPIAGVVVVVLADYLRQHHAWGWLRLMAGGQALKGTPGLTFAKVMGSGHGGGFTLRPSPSHQGLICRFRALEDARAFLLSPFVKSAKERSREFWTGVFGVDSSRGQWDQQAWATTDSELTAPGADPSAPTGHPHVLGVLTRASIRPSKAMAFWRHAPATQHDLDMAPGCMLAVGLGEAPLLRQCTFSLWESTESMMRYAHHQSHAQAIQASYRHQFFSESLFVRMQLLSMEGLWKGKALEHESQWLGDLAHA